VRYNNSAANPGPPLCVGENFFRFPFFLMCASSPVFPIAQSRRNAASNRRFLRDTHREVSPEKILRRKNLTRRALAQASPRSEVHVVLSRD